MSHDFEGHVSSVRVPGSIRRMLVAWALIGLCTAAILAADLARSTRLAGDLASAPDATVSRASGGSLVICGGGGVPEPAWRRFVELAGGRDARILIVPTANLGGDPIEDHSPIREWKRRGAGSVEWLHARTRAEAEDPNFALPLTKATGVWMEGGDQAYLMRPYLDTEVERQLVALLERGGVIGGSSAGAAVMTRLMIEGGRTEAIEATGFGFLPDAVVDQHFLRRNRLGRLLGVLDRHPDLIGLGIDERTALVVQGDRIEVLGDSYVLACIPGGSGTLPRQIFLKPGDRIDLPSLRVGSDVSIASTLSLTQALESSSSH